MSSKEQNQPITIATISVVIGMLLYLSKYLREYFIGNNQVLFILGFLPNLGLAYAIPFIYFSNRIRQNKPVNHFAISCLVSLLLMILNENRDKYQLGRVFDMLDIYASAVGVVLAYFVYLKALKK